MGVGVELGDGSEQGTEYEEIIYEVVDPVATITLNRPQALNAWTPRMGAELDDALRRATEDTSVVGIVITGAGRGFCAGADMDVLADSAKPGGPRPVRPTAGDLSWGDDFRGVFTSILSVPKPTIAAINGAVAGMAVAMVLSCDLRFMAAEAKFTTAFARRGLVSEWGTSWLLPRIIHPADALDLLLSGRIIQGEEAHGMGLVNRVVADGSVAEAAQDYVRDLAEHCSPTSMATIKRQVYQQLHAGPQLSSGLGPAEREAAQLMEETLQSEDFAEGVAAFDEKRAAVYRRVGL